MKRELVCIQVGTAANYTGAHFWNLHDEYLATPPRERELSPAPFFRHVSPASAAARSGLRYAPRLQVVDASGAFGALSTDVGSVLPQAGAPGESSAQWDRNVQRFVREPVRRSGYVKALLKGDEEAATEEASAVEPGAQYWSDFLKTRLHPRTCFPLPGVHHGVAKLERYEAGAEIATQARLEDVYNDLRFFIEECDSFGGLCITTNADDAYAGFTGQYLAYLDDELSSTSPVLLFGVHSVQRACMKNTARDLQVSFDPVRERLWAANEAKLAVASLEYAAEYVPMSSVLTKRMPLLHMEVENMFHTSAVHGLALNVALTPLQTELSLAGLLGAIRPAPFATFGGMACNLPRVGSSVAYGPNIINTTGSVSLSNAWIQEPGKAENSSQNRLPSNTLRCTEVVSARGLECSLPILSNIQTPVTVPVPYPHIFDSALERNEYARAELGASVIETPHQDYAAEQVAVISGLSTVAFDAENALLSLGKAIQPQTRGSRYTSANVEEADIGEGAESLISRAADYRSV